MSVALRDVAACLVTRGDVEMAPILETLPYATVVIWDNSRREDLKVYGRYAAIAETTESFVFLQDDDTIFRHHDELLAAHEPGRITSTWGHGTFTAGYDDLPLTCGGGIVDRDLPALAFARYGEHFPLDEEFRYEADFVSGVLTPFVHVDLPFELRREITTRPSRLCRQPWQCESKLRVTNRARWIRDHASGVPSTTDTLPARWAA